MASPSRVFELRTYHAEPGAIDRLEARFRDHTMGLFARHGFEVVGFWRALDGDGHPTDTLVYVLAFAGAEAAATAWAAFRDDPDWIAAKAASEEDGPILSSLESVYMTPTDWSPLS